MKTLEEFNQQKQVLIDREGQLAEKIDSILKAEKNGGVLPKSALDALEKLLNDLYEKKQYLESDRFYIAISGAIKSGKSTLLNALLFKKDVLSAEVTPCTAKLTIMEKSDHKEVVAQFYTREEWNQWRVSAEEEAGDGINKEEMDNYISRGDKHAEKLGKTETVEESKIGDYTAKEGELMPLVNTITIYDPEISLDGAQIVDTPGTNDPVVMRSKVAEDYIKKADAIIYALYAGKALTESDREMLQDIIIQSGKDAKNLIFAVTKKDTLKEKSFDGEINKVFDDYFNRNLTTIEKGGKMTTDLSSCPRAFVSGEAARIAQDKVAGNELDEARQLIKDDISEFLDDLTPEYILNYSGIADLKEKIESYLIENKKEVVIDGNTNFIEFVKESCKKDIFASLDREFKSKLESVQKTISDIDEEMNNKKKEIATLQNKADGIKKKREDGKIEEDFADRLRNGVLEDFARDMKKEIEKNFGDETTRKNEQIIKNICNDAREKVAKLTSNKGWWLIPGDAIKTKNEAEAIFTNLKTLNGLVKKSWRNVDASVSKVAVAYMPKIAEFLENDFNEALEKWQEDLRDVLKESEYASEPVSFPFYKIKDTVSELEKKVPEEVLKCVSEIQINTNTLSSGLGKQAEFAKKTWIDGPTQNEVIDQYIEQMNAFIRNVESYAKDNLELTRMQLDEIIGKIKENLFQEKLPNEFFEVRKELFDVEFDAAIEQIKRKMEESKTDLEIIRERKAKNEAEVEKMRAEYNAKIAKLDEYKKQIENV